MTLGDFGLDFELGLCIGLALSLVVISTYNVLQAISAEEGLIAIAYERKLDIYSRLYQVLIFSLCTLFQVFRVTVLIIFSDGQAVYV